MDRCSNFQSNDIFIFTICHSQVELSEANAPMPGTYVRVSQRLCLTGNILSFGWLADLVPYLFD